MNCTTVLAAAGAGGGEGWLLLEGFDGGLCFDETTRTNARSSARRFCVSSPLTFMFHVGSAHTQWLGLQLKVCPGDCSRVVESDF
mmetsp:Transcript_47668/g.113536  ORF Transcript_47668/g.113536 Transcript_47668/m.113536 type:complete len:85 (-) Transcript_47668:1317-1571(-)